MDREAVLGMLSLVFWSITLITTVKYVLIAMRIDNNGEGGIFALYSLIRKYGAWLAIPAMLGGAAFLADSVLTPAVSISSAVEGLQTLPPLEQLFDENPSLTLMITVVIIVILFSVQSCGTESIGKVFGSMVLVWFSFLAVVGVVNLNNDWSVFAALNPVYGVKFLFSPHNAAGIALMGTVFLSTTGAEALYSDMGHVGRGNIYFTWPFIKIALVLNYFGQGAWMLNNARNPQFNTMKSLNPFFQMMTPNVRYLAVILSVTAGVIASQALITGAFTMVSEATRLNWMPHLQVRYPARTRGQLYIPVVNGVLCVSTLAVLAIFKDSEHISAAYGLALTITMITTTVLLGVYLWYDRKRVGAIVFTVLFLAIQIMFFIASMAKFLHGEQIGGGDLRHEGLGGGNGDFRAGVRVEHGVGFARKWKHPACCRWPALWSLVRARGAGPSAYPWFHRTERWPPRAYAGSESGRGNGIRARVRFPLGYAPSVRWRTWPPDRHSWRCRRPRR
ncbi:potassium transport protein [Bifidobacterium bifidum]|nr:potassium transport protein [Bifidobacterium bifidum]